MLLSAFFLLGFFLFFNNPKTVFAVNTAQHDCNSSNGCYWCWWQAGQGCVQKPDAPPECEGTTQPGDCSTITDQQQCLNINSNNKFEGRACIIPTTSCPIPDPTQTCAYVPAGCSAPAGYSVKTDYIFPDPSSGISVGGSQCTNPVAGLAPGNSYTLYCKSQDDACSVYRVRAPLCGSSDEAEIGCQFSTDGKYLACWGNNYRRCNPTMSDFPDPAEGSRKAQGFLIGGKEYTDDITQAKLYTGAVMYNGTVPCSGSACVVNNQAIWFCDANVAGCGPGGVEVGGEGESRLWFPHLRLLAALSAMAQAIFNPQPSSLKNNAPPSNQNASLTNPGVVTTKIEKHQGVDDATTVVNKETNNSSLVVAQVVPAAETYQAQTDPPYDQMACVVPEVKNNEGDDLVGPKIVGRVLFTQKYEYDACPKPTNCLADGVDTLYPENCCSQRATDPQCHANPIDKGGGQFTCGSIPQVERQTEGKAAVYIKNPLVEYIYDVMVNGSQSLFKRFMPSINTKEFDEIPSSVAYSASAVQNTESDSPVELKTEDGNSPSFYVPHIGSLKKYWLEDLQKALRPKNAGTSSGIPPGTSPAPSPAGVCSAPDPESTEFQNDILQASIDNGGAAASVPKGVLDWIYRIEALPFYTESEPYTCSYKFGVYLGLMAMSDNGYNITVDETQKAETEVNQCVKIDGKLNRCWPVDTMEIAARLLLSKIGEYPGGKITTQREVRVASCGYYGGDTPDISTKNFAKGHFTSSQCRGGDCNNMSYADIVCLGSGYCDGTNWPKRLGDNPDTDKPEVCYQAP